MVDPFGEERVLRELGRAMVDQFGGEEVLVELSRAMGEQFENERVLLVLGRALIGQFVDLRLHQHVANTHFVFSFEYFQVRYVNLKGIATTSWHCDSFSPSAACSLHVGLPHCIVCVCVG